MELGPGALWGPVGPVGFSYLDLFWCIFRNFDLAALLENPKNYAVSRSQLHLLFDFFVATFLKLEVR